MSSLKDAFAIFSQETTRLENTYKALQEEFKKLHSQVESSSQLFQTIATHMRDGLIFITLKGEIALCNDTASLLIGYFPEKGFSSSFWDYFPDHFFGFSLQKALAEESLSQTLVLTITHSSISYEIEVSASSIPRKGILLLLRDLTEQKKLEQALSRNDRLKELGEMAAALAHEIRNPLGGIQGFASLLCRDLQEMPAQHQMAHSILEGTRSLNRLVSNVLSYARPLEVRFSLLDPVSLIQETIRLAKADPAHEAPCHFINQASSSEIYADNELLRMAFLNLLQNAFQASPQNTEVTITLFEEGNMLCIAVKDKGQGISQDYVEKIFIPFFTTKANGTGLGLSEAQKIVQAHGGNIEVHSSLGNGSTFTIKVPKYAPYRKDSSS